MRTKILMAAIVIAYLSFGCGNKKNNDVPQSDTAELREGITELRQQFSAMRKTMAQLAETNPPIVITVTSTSGGNSQNVTIETALPPSQPPPLRPINYEGTSYVVGRSSGGSRGGTIGFGGVLGLLPSIAMDNNFPFPARRSSIHSHGGFYGGGVRYIENVISRCGTPYTGTRVAVPGKSWPSINKQVICVPHPPPPVLRPPCISHPPICGNRPPRPPCGSPPPFIVSRPYGVRPPTMSPTRPVLGGVRPATHASRPVFGGSRPSFGVSRPTLHASRPSFSASRPAFHASRPSFSRGRPSFSVHRSSFSGRRSSFVGHRGGGRRR